MEYDEADTTAAGSLAKMMDALLDRQQHWEAGELAAILEHQLAAPLEVDLGAVAADVRARMASLASRAPSLRTFHDLFHHPEPPVELLDLTKRFAKQCRTQPAGPLPAEIATVLYFLAIAVARFRGGHQLSGLDIESLRGGIEWSLAQHWVDNQTRQLLQQGLSALTAERETAEQGASRRAT